MPPVKVNLGVSVDASGDINVFGYQYQEPNNIINSVITIPSHILYDKYGESNGGAENSVISFYESPTNPDTFIATLSDPVGLITNNTRAFNATSVFINNSIPEELNYRAHIKKMARDIQTVLESNMDCSGVSPFSDPKYANIPQYLTQPNFGRLALSVYAHYIFGHIAATSAITNDAEFIRAMMSWNGQDKFKYGDIELAQENIPDFYQEDGTTINPIWSTSSPTDANLAMRIVYKLISSQQSIIQEIVNQVLGQDASRAMKRDNTLSEPNFMQPLQFHIDDIINIKIRLETPGLSIQNGQIGVQNNSSTLNSFNTAKANNLTEYTLQIKLGDNTNGAPYAPSGKMIPEWIRWIDGSDNDIITLVITDVYNNIYVCGYSNNNLPNEFQTSKPGDNYGGFIIKYDIGGNIIWNKWIDGIGDDFITSMVADSKGNLYVAGQTTDNLPSEFASILTNKPSDDYGIFLIKYDINGAPILGKWLDGTGIDSANALAIDSNDNIYIACISNSADINNLSSKPDGINSDGTCLVKYDSSGNYIWNRWIDGSGNDIISSITIDPSNNIIISGTTTNNLNLDSSILSSKPSNGNDKASYIIKYNSSGNPLWGKWLDSNGEDNLMKVVTDYEGSIYATGYVYNDTTPIINILPAKSDQAYGGYIIKYNSDGNAEWAKWIHKSGFNIAYNIETDVIGNVYVTGSSSYSLSDEIHKILEPHPNAGTPNMYLIKFTSSGVMLWGTWIGGNTQTVGRKITTDNLRNIYIVGNATNQIGYPSELQSIQKPDGSNSNGSFLVKYIRDV